MSLQIQQPTVHKGIVKQVLSGDAVVIRGQPRGGPPEERTICLSNISSPRLARRANPQFEASQETKDEPWAWEAREFVRKRCIGKEVVFTIEYKVPGTGREYGCIYLGKDTTGENMTEALIQEGLVEVRRGGIKPGDENQQRLIQLEELAKAGGMGKWAENPEWSHIRDITWNIDNPRKFVDSYHMKSIDAVIEHVRDGCTVRAFLLPSFHYVTIMLSGVKCPMFKLEGDKQTAEAFAEQARFFTETRVLQREVKVILEGVSNQNLLGTVLHPNGNITELLLKEGFARCVDWSIGVVTQGPEKLRAAEKTAKDARLRIWKDYTPPSVNLQSREKSFTGKVVEVVNGDALVVKTPEGQYKKVFLASIRPPRAANDAVIDPDKKPDPQKRVRPLYDYPYMFEAREFLRKKLISKKVNVEVDYVQPPSLNFAERSCCTITSAGINVGEAVISKGLATVVRYRQDDDQRSSHYDELMAAEARAAKKGVGLHSKKDPPIHRVADISGDVTKAKQFLPFLQRAGRSEALVEMVASGSRLRLFIPRETCLITLLISGIDCPRASRPIPQGAGTIPADPYGEEAMLYTKEMCLQREVEVEIESTDKGGNFIGWLYVDGVNVAVGLVEEGLARVHFTAERSPHYKTLLNAEDRAKERRINLWKGYKDTPVEIETVEDNTERIVNYKNVLVSEVKSDELMFYAQHVDEGPQFEKMMVEFRHTMDSNPPLIGSYKPRKGDLCAAKFVDGEWYRARVEKFDGQRVHMFYVDFGNRELTTPTRLAVLPVQYVNVPFKAYEYTLACVALPEEEEAKHDAISAFANDVMNKQLRLNAEYKVQGRSCVTLQAADTQLDIALALVMEGLLLVDERREKRLAKIVSEYRKAQDKAKAERLNIWRYGDFRQDDAAEFGYNR